MNINNLDICDYVFLKKTLKISYKKFGGKEKKRTFAIPNEKRVVEKARSSYKD